MFAGPFSIEEERDMHVNEEDNLKLTAYLILTHSTHDLFNPKVDKFQQDLIGSTQISPHFRNCSEILIFFRRKQWLNFFYEYPQCSWNNSCSARCNNNSRSGLDVSTSVGLHKA